MKAGFILPYDAEQIRRSAATSDVLQSGGVVDSNQHTTNRVEIQEFLRTVTSWNGATYGKYPEGIAEPVVAKITVPAHKELTWHSHPMPNFAYVLSGEIKVEEDKGNKKHFKAGEVMPETVHIAHRVSWAISQRR